MRRLKLTIEYDGTAYAGWQSQAGNQPTIQDQLERAFLQITGESLRIHPAGRTDSGVHALGQVARLDTDSELPAWVLQKALNAHLPQDIAVLNLEEVPQSFNPRTQTLGKLYRYQIFQSKVRRPWLRRDHWHVRHTLDVAAMRRAAQDLLGEHDFASFRATGCEARGSLRRVWRLDIAEFPDGRLQIEVHATAFLKHMVRNIVGTLVDVGLGRRAADSMPEVLAALDRRAAGPTAPAWGLYLVHVFYLDDPPPPTWQEALSPPEKAAYKARIAWLTEDKKAASTDTPDDDDDE